VIRRTQYDCKCVIFVLLFFFFASSVPSRKISKTKIFEEFAWMYSALTHPTISANDERSSLCAHVSYNEWTNTRSKGNYSNDQILAQHWYNNSGQPAEQTCQMSTNQYVSPPAAQQLYLQQQPYTALNQGMQQYAHLGRTTSHVSSSSSTTVLFVHTIE